MAELSLTGIRKAFGTVEVIRGLDLTIADREFVVFVGPSGCGKSTMLRLIAGLEDVTAGSIRIDGAEVTRMPPAERGIAMVFQSYALFPHMSVAENIGFGLRLHRVDRATIAARVAAVAEVLQITALLDRLPRELSGGQRQRVAIGRAIIRNPKVFLFDEPLSNLDAALRVQMRLEIARLHARLQATMVYVTHDQTEAMTLADRIVVFNAGRIEQIGAPMELYERPANRFVAGFIGAPAMNFLPAASVIGGVAAAGASRLFAGGAGVAEIGVRPEHLHPVGPAEGEFSGTVELVERLGAETFAYVRVDGLGEALTVRLPAHAGARIGDAIGLSVEPAGLHRFAVDGTTLG